MQLKYSEQEYNSALKQAVHILAGVILGIGAFAFFCSSFGLKWSPQTALKGNPIEGMLSVCNGIAQHLGRSDYLIMKRFAAGYTEDGSLDSQGMFLTILMVMLVLLSWMIIRSGYKWLLLVYAVPAAGVMTLTNTSCGSISGLVFVFGLLSASVIMMIGDADKNMWILVIPLVTFMISLGAAVLMDNDGSRQMSRIQEISTVKLHNILERRYGENPLKSGKLSGIDGDILAQIRGPMSNAASQLAGEDNSETALEVVMDDPAPYYLRGFVGEKYSKGNWGEFENKIYYDERDTLLLLNSRNFDGLSQLAEAAKVARDTEIKTNKISIKVRDADRSRIYMPYELNETYDNIPEGMQNYAGGFMKSDRIMGSRNYTWNVSSDLTGRWTDLAGRLYSAEKDRELDDYLENESYYNVWCYEKYTDIPDEMKGLLEAAMGDPGDLSRNHADYKETIAAIRDYLDSNFIYTEDFKSTEKNKDPVEEFLLTGKGCDAHYASLASLLFRWFGIPARYVEGYIVTPGDVARAKAKEVLDIGSSHAHAWTEIYIDGLGWVPLEVTSAYRDIMPEADMEKGLEAVSYESRKEDREQIEEEGSALEDETIDYGRMLLKILFTGLGILVLLILVWIIYRTVRRQMVIRRRRQSFSDPDPRKGICAMYSYILKEEIPCSELAARIGDMAVFSNHPVEEYHRSEMRVEMERGESEKETLEKLDRSSVADRIYDLWSRMRGK